MNDFPGKQEDPGVETPDGEPVYLEVVLPLPLDQGFTYRHLAVPGEMPGPGSVVQVPFRKKRMIGVVEAVSMDCPSRKIRDIEQLFPEPYRLDDCRRRLAGWISEYYACSRGEALSLFLPPRPGTRARKIPWPLTETLLQGAPRLTGAQREAVDAVRPAVLEERYVSHLLHGVTGSGKTEVYLQLIESCLERDRSVLVLLPEIALTPQILDRIQSRFPGEVAPYHSRLSHGERCAVWEATAKGKVHVAVGARSAVFLPMRNLGMIVVDEEHEQSFKSDERPRYQGRDVALMRASMEEIPVILGSATPSLESWYNAREGKHRLLTLPDRIGSSDLPTVEILDRRGSKTAGAPLEEALSDAISGALQRGEQAIIFHNRRGFARYLQCGLCGEVIECPRCDISLTYHLAENRLRCHYCDHSRSLPGKCPSCGENALLQRGAGTQRVEVALQSRFPEARILRLDQDSTGRKSSHREILDSFGRREADILVGTQMVAKGLHFPGVTIVGIIDADAGLHFPDFRAHERSFQLLTQVSGRSGRETPGRVILQTYDPSHRVLRKVIHHDVTGFLEEELEHRRDLDYPPLRRLSAIGITAHREDLLTRALVRLAGQLRNDLQGSGIRILGPAKSTLGRINRRYRGQILLKGSLSAGAKQKLQERFISLKEDIPGSSRMDILLDVDPIHLL